jgi:ComF family protein
MTGPVNPAAARAVDGRLRRWLGTAWPSRCLACGEPGADGRDLCRACAATLPWNRSACAACALPLPMPAPACGTCLGRRRALASITAACVYARPLDRLLPRFKFHGDLAAGRLLSQLMLADGRVPPPSAVLLPVPLHAARLRSRGYDQALELARPLARALALDLRVDVLRRRHATAAQSELDAAQRRRNVRGAFAVRADRPLPVHVVLVDDVMTTGATVQAAALALRRAGVARVDAWVCARVP